MKFNPQNIQARPENFKFNLLEAGVCNFYVLDATDESSQYGDYISLNIKAQDVNGLTSEVTVFLNDWKLQEFMQEIGEIKQFNTGDINVRSLIKKKGKVMIQHKEFLSKQDGEIKLSNHVASFADRVGVPNVWKYKPKAEQGSAQVKEYTAVKQGEQSVQGEKGFEDDVPF